MLNYCSGDRHRDDVMTFSFKPKRGVVFRVGAQVATLALSVGLTLTALRVFPNLLPTKAAPDAIARSESAPHPFVGIQIHDLTPNLARRVNDDPNSLFAVPEIYGVAIARVVPDTPAAWGGLQQGDVVTRINETDIQTARQLKELVEHSNIGQSLRFDVRRGNTIETLTVSPEDAHQFFD
ncbi:MAG: PDZ domain-containing protein [Cyanobacteria bacterium J06648_11]